jgi:hypothetical protein
MFAVNYWMMGFFGGLGSGRNFPIPNCQSFPFQTIKIFLFNLNSANILTNHLEKHLFKFPHRNERKEKMENHFPQKKVSQFAKNKKAKKEIIF